MKLEQSTDDSGAKIIDYNRHAKQVPIIGRLSGDKDVFYAKMNLLSLMACSQ